MLGFQLSDFLTLGITLGFELVALPDEFPAFLV